MKRKMLCVSIIATMLLATACKKSVAEVNDPTVPEPEPQVVVETPVEEPAEENLSPVDEFIKNAKYPDRYSKDKIDAALLYTDNDIFALFICHPAGEDADKWHELYDGMEVTMTYKVASYNSINMGGIDEFLGLGVYTFKEDFNYFESPDPNQSQNFKRVMSDTLFYSLSDAFSQLKTPIYITVKGRVEGEGFLKDAELISWAVDDEHRADFEAHKLDACKSTEGAGREVITDYDYVWSKYSDHITTFEH